MAHVLFSHNQSGTRRPPNTTFLLYKWNFTNRPASSLKLRLLTNIIPHWLVKCSYIAHKVRVHSVQQLNIKKRLLRLDRYLFHFVLALLPVETAGGVIGQHRSRDKYHEYNFTLPACMRADHQNYRKTCTHAAHAQAYIKKHWLLKWINDKEL